MQTSKSQFSSVNPIQTQTPTLNTYSVIERKWVSYGDSNDYPQFLSTLYSKSSINRTCIIAKVNATYGQGLRAIDETENIGLLRANPEESMNEVFEKAVNDYVTFGGFALNVIWDQEGTGIADIYHKDWSTFRSGLHDMKEDKVTTYWYSTNWLDPRKFKPRPYPRFDPAKAEEAPTQILYTFDYEQGNPLNNFYPLPKYAGSILDIQSDIQTSNFHLNNLANGLAPGLHINLNNGIPETPQERQEIVDDIQSSYRGTDNAGKCIVSFSLDKDHAPNVTPIANTNDQYYIALDSKIQKSVLTGHQITSPLLVGINDGISSGFGSNAEEIQVAYDLFMSNTINPIQRNMLKVFNKLFHYKGYKSDLYIEPNKLVEATQNTIQTQ